ncbi:hypothetical protein KSP40_PGU012589 [Platanthera guangdongensis]|uniref:Uncharacterized protein n=1 Tax=Platanthera guangdongensis TaxID=2320717 RepID=A0ABR2LUI9_9ASPA
MQRKTNLGGSFELVKKPFTSGVQTRVRGSACLIISRPAGAPTDRNYDAFLPHKKKPDALWLVAKKMAVSAMPKTEKPEEDGFSKLPIPPKLSPSAITSLSSLPLRSEFIIYSSPMADSKDHEEEYYTGDDNVHVSTFSTSASLSSLSSTVEELDVTALSKKTEEGGCGEAGDYDEEGYHTPTSPRHRIPAALECPPAPKKPACYSRRRKRTGRCWIVNGDLKLMSFLMEVDDDSDCSFSARTLVWTMVPMGWLKRVVGAPR